MSRFVLTSLLLIIIVFHQTIDASYKYAGCFSHVFYDTYFTSSFMEPTLCFRLCDTPIIYLQKTVCRCSGAGLLHSGRQSDSVCVIPCAKPVERKEKRVNTCGGSLTYSAYIQDNFYESHGHLFNYQLQYRSCEVRANDSNHEAIIVPTNKNLARSSLNRLERCAASCLDQNSTVRLIGFNDDVEECACILSSRTSRSSYHISTVKVLPDTSCDRHCQINSDESKTNQTFKCGSLTNADIWAIYELNNSCPINFMYIKEMKRCVSTNTVLGFCTSSSSSYKYDGTLPWTTLIQIINRLGLNESSVAIDFVDGYEVPNSLKCPTVTTISTSFSSWQRHSPYFYPSYSAWSSSKTYILSNGCLKQSAYSSYVHRFSTRLCVRRPLFSFTGDVSSSEDYDDDDDDDDDSNKNSTFIIGVNPTIQFCPSSWFDLNGRCYRVSEERKTIVEAKKSCIAPSTSSLLKQSGASQVWVVGDDKNLVDADEINDVPTGELVQYEFDWQARLAFFLLDTDPDADLAETETTTPFKSIYYEDVLPNTDENNTANAHIGAINEFIVSELKENNNDSKDSSCILVSRIPPSDQEKPIIKANRLETCAHQRHVLCESNTLVVQNFLVRCLQRPLSMDPPAVISDQMTHEFCLSNCQELQTKLALIQMNKCYCVKGSSPNLLNITADYVDFYKKSCGDLCPGNSHERCGNKETIVAFQIMDSRRTFTYARTPAEAFPDFEYDSCIRLNNFNRSTIYQFSLLLPENVHPRYCLALCSKYDQKYALINRAQCLCTNNPIKDDSPDVTILQAQSCPEKCTGNYFYSCGNPTNYTVYSVYLLQPRCRHGFEVAENDQQCVYSHHSTKVNSLSAAKTYCKSIGGDLAKINDLIEIQDILPDSILHTRLMQQLLLFYRFNFVNDTRYYWIERTSDRPEESSISERLLPQCSASVEANDENCLAIQYIKNKANLRNGHERCITSSNDCSSQSAMPVCVDQTIRLKPTVVPPIEEGEDSELVNVDVQDDYRCGGSASKYHFIDDYCYRINAHEVTWLEAIDECKKDGAMIFVPEKSVSLQHLKLLYIRQRAHSSSGSAHVGVFYDSTNRTVLQYNVSDPNHNLVVPDSNAVYDLCEKTFQDRYTSVMLSTNVTLAEKTRLKKQKLGCAYIDFDSTAVPSIRCDEIPCTRTATVICQKSANIVMKSVKAKREYASPPTSLDETTTTPIGSTTTSNSDDDNSSNDSSSTEKKNIVDGSSTDPSDEDQFNSVGRDYAPVFFLLAAAGLFFILVVANMIYNKQIPRWNLSFLRRTPRRSTNSIYSPLATANEFDLN